MTRYCLDSSAYGHFMRGDSGVPALLEPGVMVGVTAAVTARERLSAAYATVVA